MCHAIEWCLGQFWICNEGLVCARGAKCLVGNIAVDCLAQQPEALLQSRWSLHLHVATVLALLIPASWVNDIISARPVTCTLLASPHCTAVVPPKPDWFFISLSSQALLVVNLPKALQLAQNGPISGSHPSSFSHHLPHYLWHITLFVTQSL